MYSTPNLHIYVVFMESLPSERVAPETLALDICASCQQLTLSATPLNVAKNELREAQGLSSSASETDKYWIWFLSKVWNGFLWKPVTVKQSDLGRYKSLQEAPGRHKAQLCLWQKWEG